MSAGIFYKVKAKRPVYDYERSQNVDRRWMDIGIATGQEDGNILIRLNAVPLEFDGVLKLQVWEQKSAKKSND